MSNIETMEVAHESVVVIYDAGSGQIVHQHEVVTLKGGRHPDEKALEKAALDEFARARPQAKVKTAVLHLAPATIKPNAAYKVDVAKRSLVELPPRVGQRSAK